MTTAAGITSEMEGRVVVVTGASSGLGAHFVRLLLDRGARVSATARRADRLAALVEELGVDRLHVCPGDVTDTAFPARLMAETAERFGGIDALVNNAGMTRATRAEEESTESFTEILAVNLISVFACSREAFPYLRDSGRGAIVNIGSALGLIGIGRTPQAGYCASKGGVVNLTRELSAQWARHGIRVNCLAPGWFPSEMTTDIVEDERGLRYIDRTVPMRRPGELSELDGPLLLLAGAGPAYLTGQTIAVDGGWTSV
jgi:NAD(P)-dependent dehydrogenase (short-subunit alcohol dehydrogenase family)